jgi:hypothetical protein
MITNIVALQLVVTMARVGGGEPAVGGAGGGLAAAAHRGEESVGRCEV